MLQSSEWQVPLPGRTFHLLCMPHIQGMVTHHTAFDLVKIPYFAYRTYRAWQHTTQPSILSRYHTLHTAHTGRGNTPHSLRSCQDTKFLAHSPRDFLWTKHTKFLFSYILWICTFCEIVNTFYAFVNTALPCKPIPLQLIHFVLP